MLRKEKRREGAIREAGRKPACLRPRRRGGLRFASPLRSPATQVSAVGRPGCRGRQPLHSAPVMASRKRLRRSRRILRKNDSSTPLRMTNVGCVPAVGAAISRPPTHSRARPRAIRESPLNGQLRPRRRGASRCARHGKLSSAPSPSKSAPPSCLPPRGRWQPPISREAAVGRGPCPSKAPESALCGIGRSPRRPGLPTIIVIFIVSAKQSLRNRLPREKCGRFALFANLPHF